jgi:hypothetical protein
MTRIVVLVLALMLLGLSAVALWATVAPAAEQRRPKLRRRIARSGDQKRLQWGRTSPVCAQVVDR